MVYLQPLPQEAAKLRFRMDWIAAVRDDGSKIPLPLSMTELQGADLTGLQKLLASGILPPGSYSGLSIKVKSAWVQTEEGEIALLVPQDPVFAAKLFQVKPKSALTLFLTFKAAGAVSGSINFTPDFSLATSGGILINLTGYVSNSEGNMITVFNKKTMRVVNAILTGRRPRGMALDQRRTRAYVAVSADDAVEIYDVFKSKFIGSIQLNFGDNPIDLALTPDGRTLLSVNHSSNTVSIIDAFARTELRRIRVGDGPTSAVVAPSGLKAYITNSRSNTVSVVDLTQRTLTVTIPVDGSPLRAAFNRAGNRLYVVSANSPNLSLIDPLRFTVTDKIFVGMGAVSIKVDFLSGLILVGKKFGGEIAIVEPASLIFIDSIKVGGEVALITIDRQENALFVVLPEKRLLRRVNLTSKKIVAELDVGKGAYAVVAMGE